MLSIDDVPSLCCECNCLGSGWDTVEALFEDWSPGRCSCSINAVSSCVCVIFDDNMFAETVVACGSDQKVELVGVFESEMNSAMSQQLTAYTTDRTCGLVQMIR